MKTDIRYLAAILVLFASFSVAGSANAAASDRHALVIGNASYKEGPLKNPANDAEDMAAVLGRLGFDVVKLVDADLRRMEDSVMEFGRRLRDGGVGLFYFAGHGVQVAGVNYLIPIGARIESEGDVRYESVNANRVLSKMQDAGNPLNMVFLDACRNNPFARKFRSPSKGLAPMDAPKGSLVVYATDAGDVAEDGTGRNGIFTKNLLREMQKPGLEVGPMIRRVRAGVLKDTGDRQLPFEVSCLTGNFYFNQAGASDSKNYSPGVAASEPIAPSLPGDGTATFDDLIESSRKKKQAEEQWKSWQEAREDEFEKAKQLDSNQYLSASQKAEAWQRFLGVASQDNPNSGRDDEMRDYAGSRLEYWKKEASSSRKNKPADSVASTNASTRLREVARKGNYIAYDDGGEGVVLDTRNKLMWAAKDNGKDINWHDAKKECENYQGGGYTDWRLPTMDELSTLYDGNASSRKYECGYSVRMATDLVHVTCGCFWASDEKDTGSRFGAVCLGDGSRGFFRPSYSYGLRFVPVRRGN